MTQRRAMEYLQDDTTDALNRWNLGIINSGVYRGYNLDKTGGALVLKLVQTTGVVEVDKDEAATTASGCVVTKYGTRIKEDGALTIGLTANATANYRIDTVWYDHERVETAGGAAASFGITNGVAGATPAPAALANPTRKVVIGYVIIPPNFSDIAVDPVEWIQNPHPLCEDVSLNNWAELVYTSGTKTITFGDVLGNCFFATLTSTKEIQYITNPKRYGKLLKLWFKTDGKLITGGNLDLDYGAVIFPANSYAEFIPRQLATGQIKWTLVSIHKGPAAHLNEINQFTKTNEWGYHTLSGVDGVDWDTTTKRLITHGNGNVFLLTIVSGQEFKDIVMEHTVLTQHQDGTVLHIKIIPTSPGDTATLQFASSNINQPAGYGTTYTLTEGDLLIFTRRAGKWDVIIPSSLGRRISSLEVNAAAKISGSVAMSFPFSVFTASLDSEPTGNPGQLYYKDQFGRVFFGGRKLRATGAKAASDILFTLQNGYRPGHNTWTREAVYFSVPKLNTGLIYTPVEMVTIRIDTNGDVTLYDDGLVTDDVLDLRPFSFLT